MMNKGLTLTLAVLLAASTGLAKPAASASKASALNQKLSLAIQALSKDQAKKAISLISVEEFKNAGLNPDLAIMTLARAQYQAGQLEAAQATYASIDKSSDRWAQAVEERAHAKAKAGDYNKAIADLTTLMSPVFVKSIGPEPNFIKALTYYRLCQYSKVIETLEKFKTNIKPKATFLMSVANGEANGKISEAARLLNEKGLKTVSYIKLAPELPNNFHLDFKAQALLKNPGEALYRRVAQMANQDLEEISKVTRKLHLVEAQLMQQLHIAEKGSDDGRKKIGKFKSESGQLIFPYNGEVWLDEVDQYQVTSESCPTAKDGVKL